MSSERNRKFNNFGGRCFITTQSIKKLKKDLRQWCLEPTGWHLKDSLDTYDISRLEDLSLIHILPAQDFHILNNPLHMDDPWYYASELSYPLKTPEYVFQEGSLKRWYLSDFL